MLSFQNWWKDFPKVSDWFIQYLLLCLLLNCNGRMDGRKEGRKACNKLSKTKVQRNTTWEYHNWQSPIDRGPVLNYRQCICHQNEVLAAGRYFYPQRQTMFLSTCSWFLSQLAKSTNKRKSGNMTDHITLENLVLNVVFICWVQKPNWSKLERPKSLGLRGMSSNSDSACMCCAVLDKILNVSEHQFPQWRW